MTVRAHIAALRARAGRFGREESGASLVEFGIVVSVFLFLIFAIIDIGRLSYTWTSAQKAAQLAARIAAVRPPACDNVPEQNLRPTGTSTSYGTLCSASGTTCQTVDIACDGRTTNATANEIFAAIRPLLPPTAVDANGLRVPVSVANLRFTYRSDPALGFLGGPFVPVVTVQLQNLRFEFATTVGALGAVATGREVDFGGDFPIDTISVSVPGEDLALGTAG